jgi:two-component system sensor histidine kinase DctS
MRRPSLLDRRSAFGARRWFLWALLVVLVAAVLAMLVWLAGRYEESQVQDRLDRDTSDAVSDLRGALVRNVESLQALHSRNPVQQDRWVQDAAALLHEHRELLRIEWRDAGLALLAQVDTGFRAPVFDRLGRHNAQSDVSLACTNARRASGPAYSPSYFVPQMEGLGLEVMELCVPLTVSGVMTGYLVATYSLNDVLTELIGKQLGRGQDVSFTEADGTRLAFHGVSRRGNRAFTSSQLLDLPGLTMVLRLDSWRVTPDLFPNVLTAMVVAMTIALGSVLVLLGRDMRKRQRAEQRLAEALAFRKAMEDSLVTGLRARDLQGHTTYVNPAFCQMVGFSARELLGPAAGAPYWPTELAGEYQQRQTIRVQGNSPPREGFESVFMRKDGTRFPVLIIEAPLIDAYGVQTGWMSAFLDISEQRRVEEMSRASQERLQATARLATVGEMASLLSHELNQPLAAISSYATGTINMLRDRRLPQVNLPLEEAMHQIAEQAQRAGRVIKSVHDFVRRREHAREAVDPRVVLDAIMPLVSLQARKLGVRIELRLEEHLPQASCDRTMVEQVLLNLTRNAMQAMDQPTIVDRALVVQVKRAASNERTSHIQGWLEFSVADAGLGITPEVADKLFTPFFTTRSEGMGLGLSLCRTVIEQHGGFLEFGPNHPQGTVFRFTLPVAPAPQAARTI